MDVPHDVYRRGNVGEPLLKFPVAAAERLGDRRQILAEQEDRHDPHDNHLTHSKPEHMTGPYANCWCRRRKTRPRATRQTNATESSGTITPLRRKKRTPRGRRQSLLLGL